METATESTPARTESNQSGGKYKISDGAMKSLRESRHSRKFQITRNDSGGSSPGPNEIPRFSVRSDSSSIWSSFLRHGRRLYGSAASVASSITLSEFGDYSEEFGVSDRSLDVKHFDEPINDNKPELPIRQCSVTVDQSQSLMGSGPSLMNSQHTFMYSVAESQNEDGSVSVTSYSQPQFGGKSVDTTPVPPGRRTSVSVCSEDNNTRADTLHAHNRPMRDSAPMYPNRKKSSKVMEEEEIASQVRNKDLREQAKLFRDTMLEENVNSFSGAEAIDHFFVLGLIISREEGVDLGRKMETELELIQPCNKNTPLFRDDEDSLYRLDPSTPVLEIASPDSSFSKPRKSVTSNSINGETPLEETD